MTARLAVIATIVSPSATPTLVITDPGDALTSPDQLPAVDGEPMAVKRFATPSRKKTAFQRRVYQCPGGTHGVEALTTQYPRLLTRERSI